MISESLNAVGDDYLEEKEGEQEDIYSFLSLHLE